MSNKISFYDQNYGGWGARRATVDCGDYYDVMKIARQYFGVAKFVKNVFNGIIISNSVPDARIVHPHCKWAT